MSKVQSYKTKAQMKERARREAEAVSVELPCGEEWQLCRAPLQTWLSNGRAPQYFTQQAFAAYSTEEGAGSGEIELKGKDLQAFLQFQSDVLCYSVVSPRLYQSVEEAEADPTRAADEEYLLLQQLDDEDRAFLFNYAMNVAPANAIAATNGHLTVEAVSSFRDGGERAASATPG